MRVKFGPFKMSPERYERVRLLPGKNDEQRLNLALDFALEHMERITRNRAEVDAQIAKIVEEERAKSAVAQQVERPSEEREAAGSIPAPDTSPFEAGPMVPIPPEMLGLPADAFTGEKLGTVEITHVDREAGVVTVKNVEEAP